MLDNKTIFYAFLIFILLLSFSEQKKHRRIQSEEERIKKGLFLDSYMLSQNARFYNSTVSEELEKEKHSKRKLGDDEITLRDVGFFAYQIGSHTRSFWSYSNIFKNIGKDRSKYIMYPYAFNYKKKTETGEIEEKEQNQGGFFSLNPSLLPTQTASQYFENIKNISSVEISKSKALYDIDIGILIYETKLDGIPINLFSEADTFCSFFVQTLSKASDCARKLSELETFRSSKPNKGQILLISPEILKDTNFTFINEKNHFGLIIIPDHVFQTEEIIIKAWGTDGTKKIKDFIDVGGNILATGKSGLILEKLGLISEGLYKKDKYVYYLDQQKKSDMSLVSLTGCEGIPAKKPAEQPDFFKQVMCMNFKNKIYLTSVYPMDKAKMEEKNELSVIMSLSPDNIGINLKYKLEDGNDQEIGSDNYFPLVLSKQDDKKGRITIINGNVLVDTTNTFQLIMDPVFYAMGKNIIFDAFIKYSDDTGEEKPIPGGEEGVRLTCYFKFLNLFEVPVKDLNVDIFIAFKTKFITIPEGCIEKVNDATKYQNNLTDMDMTHYMQCNLAQLEKYTEFSKEMTLEITDQSVTQKKTDVSIFYPLLEYTEYESNEKIFVDYGPVVTTASLAAILRVTANSEPPGDYPIFAWGNYLDQVFNVENKEDTAAKNVNLITIIPVISVLINDIRENSVVHTNEFYDAYYKKHEYIYPFTKTAEEVDFIDYAELSGKDVVFSKDFDQPVKYVKVERIDLKNNDEVKELFEVNGNLAIDVDENSLLKTNNQMLLKEICYQDADIFYELADFRRLVFLDTSFSNGAQTFYNNNIPEEDKDPADPTRAKIEVPFSRVDFFFETDSNYQFPVNVTNDTVFSTDKYEEPTIKTDKEIKLYQANISKVGNFNNSQYDGKLIPDEYYNVLKQHNQIKKFIDPLAEGYNITEDFPDISLSHYLIPIKGNRIKRAGSIKGFIEDDTGNDFRSGYLEAYPHVKFIYAHSVTFVIGKNLTRLGGKLVIDLGTNEFKDNKRPDENQFVTLSVDGVALYKIEYDYVPGEKNIIYAYFKRGLMPDETSGKDSSFDLNIENLTTTDSISATIELFELKYDLSKKETNFEDFEKVESFISAQTLTYEKFWSLPCLIIENKFERNGSDTIKEYELLDPYVRYTLYYQELIAHRTVFCNSLSNHVTNPGLQTPFTSYGLISNIGIVSIPFSDYVSHPASIIPAAPSTSRIEWDDVWGRKWAQPIRSIFPDFLPLPYVSQNFMMMTTYEIIQDDQRVLEWSSADSASVMIHIKFLNNYFKYVNLAICKENQIINGTDENDNVTMTHSKVYGKCYQHLDAVLSGRKIDETIINQMSEAMLCAESDNALEMMDCTQRIKNLNLPLLQVTNNTIKGKQWNYSPLVDSYYPEGYLDEEIMWDMTKAEYSSDVYFKGYPWHFDNNLPGFDRLDEKPDNLMAFPIFKGFGYKMDFSPNNAVPKRYNGGKGWWSDNLQNKDNTLLAGQHHVNINPTINKTILTEDSWINAKNIHNEDIQKKLKNIYICQFNQHRIKVNPQTNTQIVTFPSIFQNNVIPVYPILDDKDYREYDCTDVYQYSPSNISQADNRVKTNNDRDWLYFAVNLRAEAKETLNIILTLNPFSDRKYEGETKINDGGRFTYWNPALTKNGYIYLDNNVNVVNSYRVDLVCDVVVYPRNINTFKAVNYHLFSLEDPNERLREYKLTTYTNSYGFGDSVVMINIGGIQNTDCRIRPGETTFVKITFFNNAGFDWNMKGGAIEFDKYTIPPDKLMKEKVHSVQLPTKYNFLELEIPEPLQEYIEIEPSDHNKDVSPQFFDFECINVVTIRDGFKGEYYYKMKLKEGLDEKYFGRFWEIKVNLNSDYFDMLPGSPNDPATKVDYEINMRHDYTLKVPSIKFGIPYPSNHRIPEYRNKVFYIVGRATEMFISYNIQEEFSFDDVKIVSEEEVEKLKEATTNQENANERLLDIWNNGIANKSSYLTGEIAVKKLEAVNQYKRIYIYLNDSFPQFPYEVYGEPDRTKLYILTKVSAPQVTYGSRLVLKWGYGEFNDSRKRRKTNVDLARTVSAYGPWIKIDTEKTILRYNKTDNNFTESSNQTHYTSTGYMKLKITALNGGSKEAHQLSYKYVFSRYVEILDNYGDVLNKKEIINLNKNETSGETTLIINSKKTIPQNTKDTYNIYLKYDFEEGDTMDSILVQRNLEENNEDKVILKSANVTLCQNVICNDDDSFVNQLININFKMSMVNVVEMQPEPIITKEDEGEVESGKENEKEIKKEKEKEKVKEKEIKKEKENEKEKDEEVLDSKKENLEKKTKIWIIPIIIACLIVISLIVYLIIDYKKKLWIFKNKEIPQEEKVVNIEKDEMKETGSTNTNTERINVKKKRSIKNYSLFANDGNPKFNN